jgi:hypothetical protein
VASPLTARDRGRPGTSPASPCPTERTRVVAKKIGPMSSRRFASPSGPARPTDTATGRLGAVRPRRTRSNPPRARDSPTSDLHSSETSCLSLHQPECCCGRDPGVGGHAIGVGAAPTALLRDIDRPGWVQTGDLSRQNGRAHWCFALGLIRLNTAGFGPTNEPTARLARETQRLHAARTTGVTAAAHIGAAARRIVGVHGFDGRDLRRVLA